MKIHIFYTFKEKAWGGGNQFLKALKQEFEKKSVYAESLKKADVVIFNGYQEIKPLLKSWLFDHGRVRVYRLGPVMSLHRSGIKWQIVDMVMALIASLCADVVIFQSHWSYIQALRFGFNKNKKYSVISNAVDETIFFKKETEDVYNPVRLVYTSWSSNPNKGFSFLEHLDKYLDFNKYQMKFIGNSPVSFKNIQIVSPLKSNDLAKELQDSDIFISPTKDDACSNAILEALSCGLPVVALASGGNGELVDGAGVQFSNNKEMMEAIDEVAGKYGEYRNKIRTQTISEIADKYMAAIRASIR